MLSSAICSWATLATTAQKKKKTTKLVACIILFHLLFQEVKKMKNHWILLPFLPISSTNAAAHFSYCCTATDRSTAATHSSQAPYSLSTHYTKKYDILTATTLSFWGRVSVATHIFHDIWNANTYSRPISDIISMLEDHVIFTARNTCISQVHAQAYEFVCGGLFSPLSRLN